MPKAALVQEKWRPGDRVTRYTTSQQELSWGEMPTGIEAEGDNCDVFLVMEDRWEYRNSTKTIVVSVHLSEDTRKKKRRS